MNLIRVGGRFINHLSKGRFDRLVKLVWFNQWLQFVTHISFCNLVLGPAFGLLGYVGVYLSVIHLVSTEFTLLYNILLMVVVYSFKAYLWLLVRFMSHQFLYYSFYFI